MIEVKPKLVSASSQSKNDAASPRSYNGDSKNYSHSPSSPRFMPAPKEQAQSSLSSSVSSINGAVPQIRNEDLVEVKSSICSCVIL